MRARSAAAGLVGCVAVFLAAVLVAPALAGDGGATRTGPGIARFVEPHGERIADGVYLGYVRAQWPDDDDIVAVDFVSLADGIVHNERPEVLTDAGLLARIDGLEPSVDLFDSAPRPFRITIRRHAITAVESADDILDELR